MDMEYPIYVSESKVEMLYGQLPPKLAEQLGAEIGASIGLVSAKLKTNQVVLSPFQKAKIIETHIEKTCGFGSLYAPGDWIKDDWEVRYVDTDTSLARSMFLLLGDVDVSEDKSTYFLLGGSAQNIVGNKSATAVKAGLSYLPFFLNAFKEGFAEWEKAMSSKDVWLDKEGARIRHNYDQSGSELALSVRELYEASKNVTPMRVKFAARMLAKETSQSGKIRAHIYSPLYVASAPN